MIINQVINNGFCVVTKTGSYFSLVSASGVVRVKLELQGRTVLDTKMWVGMSLDKAMPFDTITIHGEDSPIEFWAGDVAMSQATAFTSGAKAIKTKQVAVMGAKQLTSSDVTRSSVRIRSNKELFIGGAGVGGNGWRVQANILEDIPVAGVISGFSPLPELNIEGSELVISEATQPKHSYEHNLYVSEDEAIRLTWKQSGTSNQVKIWQQDTGWTSHPLFAGLARCQGFNIIHCKTDGYLYAFRMLARKSGSGGSLDKGEILIYRSKDSGLTFSLITNYNWGAQTEGAQVNNSFIESNIYTKDGVITFSHSGIAIGFNIRSEQVKATAAGSLNGFNSHDIRRFAWLDNAMTKAVVIHRTNKKLMLTRDGGQSFTEVSTPELPANSKFAIAEFGNHAALVSDDGYLYLSDDDFESFTRVINLYSWQNSELPRHLFNGVWLGFHGKKMRLFYLINGETRVIESTNDYGTISASVAGLMLNNGKVYRKESNSDKLDIWQSNLAGDLDPAIVEVMELLN